MRARRQGLRADGCGAQREELRVAHELPALPAPLESNVPGVFAVGDVRSGSVKRVGGAIGEGAAVVAQVHAFLSHA